MHTLSVVVTGIGRGRNDLGCVGGAVFGALQPQEVVTGPREFSFMLSLNSQVLGLED